VPVEFHAGTIRAVQAKMHDDLIGGVANIGEMVASTIPTVSFFIPARSGIKRTP
jgi:hypothetical protein